MQVSRMTPDGRMVMVGHPYLFSSVKTLLSRPGLTLRVVYLEVIKRADI